jgi:hypothetical protein
MSTTTSTYLKVILNRRALVIGLIVILSVIVTTGFIWVQSDPVIAPPGLRILNWLWSVFVCRCPV